VDIRRHRGGSRLGITMNGSVDARSHALAKIRLGVALGGADRGRSGIGRFVRAILPRVISRVAEAGGSVVTLGTSRDLTDLAAEIRGADTVSIPSVCDRPALSAAWHLSQVGRCAARAGADVLLLPAANRRTTRMSPVPTVAVVHDLAQLHVDRKYDPLRTFYLRRVLVPALRSASRLVAVSESTRRDVASAIGCSPEHVRVVHNGVDMREFGLGGATEHQVAAARQAAGLADGPYLLYPARLEHPGKNHVRLLHAFACSTVRRFHALLLAGADWGAGKRIADEIRVLGLHDKVKMLGYVSNDVLGGLLAGADAVLVVGLHEGFGLPGLEGLACGRPLVVSRTGAPLESVRSFAADCDPYDDVSMRIALERVVADVPLRARAAADGPGWASRWNWDRTVQGLLDACAEAVAP
jgi:glycosyltransferase involved in cell wall biosynthesis